VPVLLFLSQLVIAAALAESAGVSVRSLRLRSTQPTSRRLQSVSATATGAPTPDAQMIAQPGDHASEIQDSQPLPHRISVATAALGMRAATPIAAWSESRRNLGSSSARVAYTVTVTDASLGAAVATSLSATTTFAESVAAKLQLALGGVSPPSNIVLLRGRCHH
jgi:hypothetical protein